MMRAKMTTPGFLKIKVFWNKSCDVITYVHDVTNKIISRDSIFLRMWSSDQSLVTLAFHKRSYYNLSFIKIWL